MADLFPVERNRQRQSSHHEGVEVPDFPRIEKALKLLKGRPPGRALDVGYSPGSFADYLTHQGWDCTCLDLNRPPDRRVRIVQCDLNNPFPIGTGLFDLVTAGEVIEHLFDELAFLQECHRVLKPGGLLALTTPNLCFSLNRIRVLFGQTPLFVTAPYHYHFHTLKTLRNLVQSEGFSIEKVTSSHVLYSRRRHSTGIVFERLGDAFPTLGAHLILLARKLAAESTRG